VGYYRITGRVDDVVIVSGHNLGTAPLKMLLTSIQQLLISNCSFSRHKGNALYVFCYSKRNRRVSIEKNLRKSTSKCLTGPIAKLDKINLCLVYLKHVQAKLCVESCKIAEGDYSNFDNSTLLNPEIVEEIKNGKV
jgi:acetyl-CoA synthetase